MKTRGKTIKKVLSDGPCYDKSGKPIPCGGTSAQHAAALQKYKKGGGTLNDSDKATIFKGKKEDQGRIKGLQKKFDQDNISSKGLIKKRVL